MTLKELLTSRAWVEMTEIANRYPNFINFIIKRYGNYTSRYSQEVFQNLWISLILNNQAELAFAETLTGETSTRLAPDKFGDVVVSKNTNLYKRDSENVNSYKGYDVEGDFSKYKTSGENTNTAETTSSAVNYFSYLSGINNSRFRDTWKHIVRQVLDLCETIYLPME